MTKVSLVAGFVAVGAMTASGSMVSVARGSTYHEHTVLLNTYQSPMHDFTPKACDHSAKCGPRVKAAVVLAVGTTYTIRVSGAVSVSGAGFDHHYRCGKPAPKPEFGSPGITPQPANYDAQFLFAEPGFGMDPCPKLPIRSDAFVIKLSRSARWYHPLALGRPTETVSRTRHVQHLYKFTVKGRGAAPSFRFADYHPSDNDGEFRIQILARKQHLGQRSRRATRDGDLARMWARFGLVPKFRTARPTIF